MFATLASLSDGGWTILLVEQNARSGLAIADRGAVLDGGVVKLTGPGRKLLDDPRVLELTRRCVNSRWLTSTRRTHVRRANG